MSVELRPVIGFPGYWVSREGVVFSDRRRHAAGYCKGSVAVIDPSCRHSLTQRANSKSGYLQIQLKVDGKRSARYVHALVLEAWIGPRQKGQEARHLDGDKTNNRLDNLAWGTAIENAADRERHGTHKRGGAHANAKLDEVKVIAIREMRQMGHSYPALARMYGVSMSTVQEACTGETWKHVAGGAQ